MLITYYSQDQTDIYGGFHSFSIQNIPNGSKLLYLYSFLAYVYSFLLLLLLNRIGRYYSKAKQYQFFNEYLNDSISSKALLLRNIPHELQNEKLLEVRLQQAGILPTKVIVLFLLIRLVEILTSCHI